MLYIDYSDPIGHHVRLRPSRLPLPVRALAEPSRSGVPALTSGHLAHLHQRTDCRAVTFRVEGRHSRECFGFLLASEAREPSGTATVMVCGTSVARTLSPALLDAAVVATELLFDDERTVAVEVSLLGAGRDLCRRMRSFGFEQVGTPRVSPGGGLATSARESVFRLDRSRVQAATVAYETIDESPTRWLLVPPHPFPA